MYSREAFGSDTTSLRGQTRPMTATTAKRRKIGRKSNRRRSRPQSSNPNLARNQRLAPSDSELAASPEPDLEMGEPQETDAIGQIEEQKEAPVEKPITEEETPRLEDDQRPNPNTLEQPKETVEVRDSTEVRA